METLNKEHTYKKPKLAQLSAITRSAAKGQDPTDEKKPVGVEKQKSQVSTETNMSDKDGVGHNADGTAIGPSG